MHDQVADPADDGGAELAVVHAPWSAGSYCPDRANDCGRARPTGAQGYSSIADPGPGDRLLGADVVRRQLEGEGLGLDAAQLAANAYAVFFCVSVASTLALSP